MRYLGFVPFFILIAIVLMAITDDHYANVTPTPDNHYGRLVDQLESRRISREQWFGWVKTFAPYYCHQDEIFGDWCAQVDCAGTYDGIFDEIATCKMLENNLNMVELRLAEDEVDEVLISIAVRTVAMLLMMLLAGVAFLLGKNRFSLILLISFFTTQLTFAIIPMASGHPTFGEIPLVLENAYNLFFLVWLLPAIGVLFFDLRKGMAERKQAS
jgi:hypothetical protein